MNLRPYQLDAVQAIGDHLGRHRSTLAVMPTGTGKTVVFAKVAEAHRGLGRVLVLAHREELLLQASDKIREWTNLTVELEIADQRADLSGGLFAEGPDVVVASKDSLAHRLDRYPSDSFGLVIVDEAHHAPAKRYQSLLEHFSPAKVLGVTATPDRLDGMAMGEVFETAAFVYEIRDAIESGYLCPIRQKVVEVESLDLSRVKTVAGDFNQGQLAEVMEDERNLHEIAVPSVELAGDRPTLVFTVSVEQAHLLEAVLNRYAGAGKAVALDGSADRDTRRRTIASFLSGDVQFLVNCGLFTEGFDAPGTACVVMARPTKSRALYCLDDETEILTPDGWKHSTEIDEGSIVAGFDPYDSQIRWEPVLAYVRRELLDDEKMVALKSPTIDLRVTDTHRMVYAHRQGRDRRWIDWKIKPAGELLDQADHYRLPAAGHQSARGVELTDDEIRFVGWVQTDGTVNRSNGAIQISQSTAAADRCKAIESMLDGCGLKWRYSDEGRPTAFGERTAPQRVYRVSRGAPRGEDKHLSGWGHLAGWIPKASPDARLKLEHMTEEQWGVFLYALHLGDGSKQEGQSWTRHGYHIATADRDWADWLQSMCLRRGWRCNIAEQQNPTGPIWMVHTRSINWRSVGGRASHCRPKLEVDESHPGEKVWCVSVPSGAIMVRRNGKAIVVGNTQMIGRGTRPAPRKDDLLVLDFAGNAGQHSLISALDVLEGRVDDETKELARKLAQDGKLDILAALEAAEEELARRERLEEARRRRQTARAKYGTRTVDPFKALSANSRPGRWGGIPPTPKQVDALRRFGVDVSETELENGEAGYTLGGSEFDKGQASALLDKLVQRATGKLCTYKQARFLLTRGLDPDVTFDTARSIMDAISSNGWRVPPSIAERFALREKKPEESNDFARTAQKMAARSTG